MKAASALVALVVGAAIAPPESVKAPDDQNAWLAVDRSHRRDEHGTMQTTGTHTGYCLDYWSRSGERWTLLRRDIVANCSS